MNSKKNAVKKLKRKRNSYLLLLGLLGAIAGCLTAILAYSQSVLLSAVQIVCNLGAIILIYLWIINDARIHNYHVPQYLKILIILLPFFGLPVYFWQTRNGADFWINIGGLWLGAFYTIIYLIFTYAIALLFF